MLGQLLQAAVGIPQGLSALHQRGKFVPCRIRVCFLIAFIFSRVYVSGSEESSASGFPPKKTPPTGSRTAKRVRAVSSRRVFLSYGTK